MLRKKKACTEESAMKTYRIDWKPDDRGFVEVQGREVKIKGFERFEFFVHERPDMSFGVSERNSGGSVSGTSDLFAMSEEDAIRNARRNLRKAGVEVFARMIEAAIRDHGHIDGRSAPRSGAFDRDYLKDARRAANAQ